MNLDNCYLKKCKYLLLCVVTLIESFNNLQNNYISKTVYDLCINFSRHRYLFIYLSFLTNNEQKLYLFAD